MIDLSLGLLERQLKQLSALHGGSFSDFKSTRDYWDSLIRRRAKVKLEASLAAYADDIDIQSSALEFKLGQLVDILTLNPTKIDLVCLEPQKHAKDDVEDCRIVAGSWWRQINDGRVIDTRRAEAMMRYGVSVERSFATLPDDEDDMPFRLEVVNPLECCWLPLADPDIVIQESELNFVEANELRNDEGNWLTLDAAGKCVFLGDARPVFDNSRHPQTKRIRVVTRAMKDLDSVDDDGKAIWYVSEYVYTAGTEPTATGALMSSCGCPLPNGPYFIIPSAAQRGLETDPHLRFRPRMYPLYVLYQQLNYELTRLAALALKFESDYHVYIDLSSLNPQQQTLVDQLFPTEGEGSQRYLVFPTPNPGSGEIPMLPHIERYPADLSEALTLSIQYCKEEIEAVSPNRFLIGNPSRTEISEGTGTAIINMQQAAGLAPSNDLAQSDAGTARIIRSWFDAIVFWDREVIEGEYAKAITKYRAVATGDEPLTKGSKEAGTEVFVDAEKASRKFQINVLTKNQTQAEEMQEALMAFQDSAQGVITDEQKIAARGYDDPRKQMELLEADKQRKALEPQKMQLINQANVVLFIALTGLDIAALMGAPVPQPPQSPAPQDQSPESTPNRQPGENPLWRAPQQSDINPQPQPQPPAPRSAGPAITPAPIGGPQGGNAG